MIREWLWYDGTIAQYDTITKFIQFLDPGTRENIVPPHKATDDEIDEYKRVYPEATQEEMMAKNTVISALQSALLEMRDITSDSQVTAPELTRALPAVTSAMEKYRDYTGPRDDVIDKLVNLLLSQSVLALQILVSNAYAGLYNTVIQSAALKTNVEEFGIRLDEHIQNSNP